MKDLCASLHPGASHISLRANSRLRFSRDPRNKKHVCMSCKYQVAFTYAVDKGSTRIEGLLGIRWSSWSLSCNGITGGISHNVCSPTSDIIACCSNCPLSALLSSVPLGSLRRTVHCPQSYQLPEKAFLTASNNSILRRSRSAWKSRLHSFCRKLEIELTEIGPFPAPYQTCFPPAIGKVCSFSISESGPIEVRLTI